MSRHLVKLPRSDAGALDLVSHGRGGPSATALTPEQVAQVARTVRRVPEVMVKVSGGGRDRAGVLAHLRYIDRHGRAAVVTDDGHVLKGRRAAELLADAWNLDLCSGQYRPKPAPGERDRRPRMVFNIVLSMPAPTPPAAVLAAARRFAREQFALQHRYAMVLHTDQAHPHVHLVVKAEAEFEPLRRLHITKPMLRAWRQAFAHCLRLEGVQANATPRALRGRTKRPLKDAIHRRVLAVAAHRALPPEVQAGRAAPSGSTFLRGKVAQVAERLRAGKLDPVGAQALTATRAQVVVAWQRVAAMLRTHEPGLADDVQAFVRDLPPPQTDEQRIAAALKAVHTPQRRARGEGCG